MIDLIRRQPVSTQQEIVQHMMESGFTVTQSSVSRDIRELGLIKTGGRYVFLERTTDSVGAVSSQVGPGLVTAIETAGSTLIVVRSTEGSASAVALALDRLGLPDIVGTIAGDDTVFVAVRSRSAQGRVVARLHGWLRPPPVRHAATTSAAPVGAL